MGCIVPRFGAWCCMANGQIARDTHLYAARRHLTNEQENHNARDKTQN